MGFSAKQVQALRRQPNPCHIRTRQAHGRELTYLEGWYAISEANRIFGFDGWSRETRNPAACWRAKTRAHSSPSTLRGFASRYGPRGQPSFEKAMAPAKVAAPPPARCMTLPLRLRKPMPPNGRLPHSVDRLVLSFTGAADRHPRSPYPRLPSPCPPMAAVVCIRTTRRLFHGRPATTVDARI